MGSFSGYYSGERKKKKKEALEKQAGKLTRVWTPPKIEIIGKGKSK